MTAHRIIFTHLLILILCVDCWAQICDHYETHTNSFYTFLILTVFVNHIMHLCIPLIEIYLNIDRLNDNVSSLPTVWASLWQSEQANIFCGALPKWIQLPQLKNKLSKMWTFSCSAGCSMWKCSVKFKVLLLMFQKLKDKTCIPAFSSRELVPDH